MQNQLESENISSPKVDIFWQGKTYQIKVGTIFKDHGGREYLVVLDGSLRRLKHNKGKKNASRI